MVGGAESAQCRYCKNMYDIKVKGGHNGNTTFQARRNNFRICGSFSGVLPLWATGLWGVSLPRGTPDDY